MTRLSSLKREIKYLKSILILVFFGMSYAIAGYKDSFLSQAECLLFSLWPEKTNISSPVHHFLPPSNREVPCSLKEGEREICDARLLTNYLKNTDFLTYLIGNLTDPDLEEAFLALKKTREMESEKKDAEEDEGFFMDESVRERDGTFEAEPMEALGYFYECDGD